MIVVDRSRLKLEWRNLEYKEGLEEFLTKVAMLKPMCKYGVADKDVESSRYRDKEDDEIKVKHWIKRIRVYENGERIGSIGRGSRWRDGKDETVYDVEGFRVSKSRGRQNVTQTKDLKVALRTVKQVFTPRGDLELKELIGNTVRSNLQGAHNSLANSLRWDFNIESTLCEYAMEAYRARRQGDTLCGMPAKPTNIRNLVEHDKKCDNYGAVSELWNLIEAKKGFGIKTNVDKSIVVYNYETDNLTKFNSYNELPEPIASKYAVFNVLEVNEAQPNIGIKFDGAFAFISI
jgi:hypothetical protein